MRVGFYAPLKPPDHPVPSGDRLVARLLIQALRTAGHEVSLMSRFRSRDGAGDAARQGRLANLGRRQPDRILRRTAAATPELWFTYHLYHKAPDLIGPAVADRLGIPYVVAEASFALKQAAGPWAAGHAAVARALRRADAVIGLNPADAACVLPQLADPARYHALPPFLDAGPFELARAARAQTRTALAGAHGLDPAQPWLVTVAMMRPGDKLARTGCWARRSPGSATGDGSFWSSATVRRVRRYRRPSPRWARGWPCWARCRPSGFRP
jgi:hypothetical protein